MVSSADALTIGVEGSQIIDPDTRALSGGFDQVLPRARQTLAEVHNELTRLWRTSGISSRWQYWNS